MIGALIRLRRLSGVFFSSRRRHTRYWRDWSSDVCSSDLVGVPNVVREHEDDRPILVAAGTSVAQNGRRRNSQAYHLFPERSEERRVGKECRSRWSPYP